MAVINKKTIKYGSLLILLVLQYGVFSQNKTPQDSSIFPEINANFLAGYYIQDGENSAVTGGKGTEYLTDFIGKTIINVVLDSSHSFTTGISIDQYSSASTDNIDFSVSSASSSDNHIVMNGSYSYKNKKKSTFTVGAGFSNEWDVQSGNINLSWNKLAKNENSGFTIGTQLYRDQWELIYPVEFRNKKLLLGKELLPDDVRYLASLNLKYFKILNKRMQIGAYLDFIHQRGLLSTPFHRVFFTNSQRDIERLPSSKWKLPISFQFNYFAFDRFIIKIFNRYYYDNFDLQALTSNLEIAYKVNQFIVITPSYRLHTQTASKYFKPYLMHKQNSTFYTSDYDLSAFRSHKMGLAIKYTPLYGLLPFRLKPLHMHKNASIKSISLRAGYYTRSNGLIAKYASIGMAWAY